MAQLGKTSFLKVALRAYQSGSLRASVLGANPVASRFLSNSAAAFQQADPKAESASTNSKEEPPKQDTEQKAEDNTQQNANSSSSEANESKPSFFKTLKKDLHDTLSSHEPVFSATKLYTGPVLNPEEYTGTSAIVVMKQERTGWQKAFHSIGEKTGLGGFFDKIRGVKVSDTAAFQKGKEFVDDIKEKYETTDHPLLHKVEEVKSNFATGSEPSMAMHEIRIRDPFFNLNHFVKCVKFDAPGVTKAFLTHDIETLKLHCGPELIERFTGIFNHFAAAGHYDDPTILFVGDVEIVEIRRMEDDPFIIIQFHCQQLKCTRDKFGNVIDGAADAIQRVYYFWGLQQEKVGVITADGKVLPPRWVIKDMMWQSRLALV